MRTRIWTIENIKVFIFEVLFSKTDKVSKISNHSGLNGLIYSFSKLFQKGMKDSAIIESELFPENAIDEDLDLIAKRQGIGLRYGALSSTTYMRVVGEVGTVYSSEKNIFISISGLQFKASKDWTIPSEGFTYIKVKSLLQGTTTTVPPYSINKILAPPTGHLSCINEVMSTGARDQETDISFRNRIQERFNIVSTETLSKLTQILIELNPTILKLQKIGRSSKGITILGVITQDGSSLTQDELNSLLELSRNFLSLSDLKVSKGEYIGVEFRNIEYTLVNVDFRVDLYKDVDVDEFATKIQVSITKYLDWRYWDEDKKVEWDELFFIIKKQTEVKYLPDQYFHPNSDTILTPGTLPRLASFIIRNSSGEILSNNKGTLKPVFYENYLDTDFSSAILSNL